MVVVVVVDTYARCSRTCGFPEWDPSFCPPFRSGSIHPLDATYIQYIRDVL